jgi:hypothetical protein
MVGEDMKNVQGFLDGSDICIPIDGENFVIVLLLALFQKFMCTLDVGGSTNDEQQKLMPVTVLKK